MYIKDYTDSELIALTLSYIKLSGSGKGAENSLQDIFFKLNRRNSLNIKHRLRVMEILCESLIDLHKYR